MGKYIGNNRIRTKVMKVQLGVHIELEDVEEKQLAWFRYVQRTYLQKIK